jgi:hypothetical protein
MTTSLMRSNRQAKRIDNSIKGSQEFFSGNISSLLNVASDVSRIEIKGGGEQSA